MKIPPMIGFFIYKKTKKTYLLKIINRFFNIKVSLINFNIKKKFLTLKLYSLNWHHLKIIKIFLNNLFLNLFKTYKEKLKLEGIGYKVWKKKNQLKFKLGFSKAKYIKITKGVLITIRKFKKICLYSFNRELLTSYKQKIRNLKKPDIYKKKGIQFYNEKFKLKIIKKKK